LLKTKRKGSSERKKPSSGVEGGSPCLPSFEKGRRQITGGGEVFSLGGKNAWGLGGSQNGTWRSKGKRKGNCPKPSISQFGRGTTARGVRKKEKNVSGLIPGVVLRGGLPGEKEKDSCESGNEIADSCDSLRKVSASKKGGRTEIRTGRPTLAL